MFLWEGSRSFKFISYENIYDNIGWIMELHTLEDLLTYAVKDEYIISSLKKFSNCNYGEDRFKTLQERLKDREYLEYLSYYYDVLKEIIE